MVIEIDIATIIFTYNRSLHTKKVLETLKNNTVLPEKLFIFQDGLGRSEDREELLMEWTGSLKNIVRLLF